MDVPDARSLAGTEDVRHPSWSPDSRFLGFFAQGNLKRIAVGEGGPEVLADAPTPACGTWSRDGIILFSPGFDYPMPRVAVTGALRRASWVSRRGPSGTSGRSSFPAGATSSIKW